MVKLELELCELDGVLHTNHVFAQAPWRALLISTLLGWRWGKQHWICFLVLYVWVIAIQPLATHIMDVGRKSNAEVGILYICSLKMTKMHFRDHFPTVGEIEK